jgi:hypothetical protein
MDSLKVKQLTPNLIFELDRPEADSPSIKRY